MAAPAAAEAHGVLEGADNVYAALLHPILVPAEALTLIAVSLLLGASGLRTARAGLTGLAIAFAAGLLVGTATAANTTTVVLLAIVLVSGCLVAADVRLPAVVAVAIATVAGVAVGIDARPEARTASTAFLAGAATLMGGLVLSLIISSLVVERRQHWQRMAIRVSGAWIAACGILLLALVFKTGSI